MSEVLILCPTYLVIVEHQDRSQIAGSGILQAFESPWPLIQANAVYFAGCMLSEISDSRPLAIYLPQVSSFFKHVHVQLLFIL